MGPQTERAAKGKLRPVLLIGDYHDHESSVDHRTIAEGKLKSGASV
jgi:hypothetical protein